MSPATVAVDAAPAAALYAALSSVYACNAKAFAELLVPLTCPGPPGAIPVNPVIAVPGLTPRFPRTTVGPLLVTVEPARTPNVSTVGPRAIWALSPTESADQTSSAANRFTRLR